MIDYVSKTDTSSTNDMIHPELNMAIDFVLENNQEQAELLLIHRFDDNYSGEGTLEIRGEKYYLESIWTDIYNDLYIHVSSENAEGDILFRLLSIENQIKIIKIISKHKLH